MFLIKRCEIKDKKDSENQKVWWRNLRSFLVDCFFLVVSICFIAIIWTFLVMVSILSVHLQHHDLKHNLWVTRCFTDGYSPDVLPSTWQPCTEVTSTKSTTKHQAVLPAFPAITDCDPWIHESRSVSPSSRYFVRCFVRAMKKINNTL